MIDFERDSDYVWRVTRDIMTARREVKVPDPDHLAKTWQEITAMASANAFEFQKDAKECYKGLTE